MLPDGAATGLTIQSIGLAADFIPRRPCLDTLYAPFRFAEGSGTTARQLLFLMGGHVDEPQTDGLSSPGRFADKIYLAQRTANGWGNPQLIIQKSFFPWMASDAFLQANPQTFIGSVAGPNVIKIGSTYTMFFSASVSDPNICTGEHPPNPNVHGSCLNPWSYFTIFCATSPDGTTWTLRDCGSPSANVALQYSALFYDPSPAETTSGMFKGLGMPHGVILLNGQLYLFAEFWSSIGLRNVLFRSTDPASTAFDVWNGGGWEPCTGGRLPAWANGDIWKGNPYAHIINQVTPATQLAGSRYLLTAQGAGGSGINNCIEVAGSNDLLTWSPAQIVSSTIPTASGAGASNSVLNPIYFEDDAGYHFLFATNDYNLDGQPDCDGPYPGLAIFQGDPTATQTAHHQAAGGQSTG